MMAIFDKYEKLGPYHWGEVSRSLHKHNIFTKARYDIVLNIIREEKPSKILDVGCGDGALTYLMSMDGPKVVGIDTSPLAISYARQMTRSLNSQLEFVVGSALQIPFGDAAFDIVTAIDIIEHMDKPDDMIKECRRAVKPGGLVVLSTPQRLTETPIDPLHIKEFYANELVNFLSEYLTEVEVMESHPVIVAELFWRLRSRKLIRYAVNFMSIYLSKNPFKSNSFGKFYVMLAAKGRKPLKNTP
jgi:ubiquinone biosynthesis O-methyltransferase